MIIDDFKSFPPLGRIMGIDWGAKRVGVAVSSPDRKFVFARETNADILKTISEEGIVGIVLGLPLRLDGTDSDTTRRVRKFAAELAAATLVPIVLFDESLTSFEAATGGAKNLDSESARVLLENAIAVMKRQ